MHKLCIDHVHPPFCPLKSLSAIRRNIKFHLSMVPRALHTLAPNSFSKHISHHFFTSWPSASDILNKLLPKYIRNFHTSVAFLMLCHLLLVLPPTLTRETLLEYLGLSFFHLLCFSHLQLTSFNSSCCSVV